VATTVNAEAITEIQRQATSNNAQGAIRFGAFVWNWLMLFLLLISAYVFELDLCRQC
jgi:hypothetical protein